MFSICLDVLLGSDLAFFPPVKHSRLAKIAYNFMGEFFVPIKSYLNLWATIPKVMQRKMVVLEHNSENSQT